MKHGGRALSCKQCGSMEEVLSASDIVSLHTLLDDTTHHMIDAAALKLMKPDAVLVCEVCRNRLPRFVRPRHC
eukprot:SAG11_NODE_2139_length_3762_cov_1.452634_4_plen_73_part_00